MSCPCQNKFNSRLGKSSSSNSRKEIDLFMSRLPPSDIFWLKEKYSRQNILFDGCKKNVPESFSLETSTYIWILCLWNFLNVFLMLSGKFANCANVNPNVNWAHITIFKSLQKGFRKHLLAKILLTRLKRKFANSTNGLTFFIYKIKTAWKQFCNFNFLFYLIKISEKCTNFPPPGALFWPRPVFL